MENLLVAILVSSIFALFSKYKKALTDAGTIMGWILSIVITFSLGIRGFTILLMTFVGTLVAGKIKHQKRDKIIKDINQKPGKRDFVQVFVNVGIGSLAASLFYITKDDIYVIVYACVMASSLADSMASEFGVLSKKNPIDICTFKRSARGISGGVSILGLCSSLLGSLVIGVTFYVMNGFNLFDLLFITGMGFMGALIDSIFGSLVQVKYKCAVCGKKTEKKEHCNKKTIYSRGIKFVNNDVVNFLNNLSVFVLSLIILISR